MIGGPPGICSALWQIATHGLISSGCPFAVTRVAPTIQRVVTQGCGLLGGTVKAQPAISPWSVNTAAGMPDTCTRGLAATMFSTPP